MKNPSSTRTGPRARGKPRAGLVRPCKASLLRLDGRKIEAFFGGQLMKTNNVLMKTNQDVCFCDEVLANKGDLSAKHM